MNYFLILSVMLFSTSIKAGDSRDARVRRSVQEKIKIANLVSVLGRIDLAESVDFTPLDRWKEFTPDLEFNLQQGKRRLLDEYLSSPVYQAASDKIQAERDAFELRYRELHRESIIATLEQLSEHLLQQYEAILQEVVRTNCWTPDDFQSYREKLAFRTEIQGKIAAMRANDKK